MYKCTIPVVASKAYQSPQKRRGYLGKRVRPAAAGRGRSGRTRCDRWIWWRASWWSFPERSSAPTGRSEEEEAHRVNTGTVRPEMMCSDNAVLVWSSKNVLWTTRLHLCHLISVEVRRQWLNSDFLFVWHPKQSNTGGERGRQDADVT